MTRLAEDAKRALVQVRTGAGGAGAGTIWHPDGLIVTNAHVVRHPPLSVVLADGRIKAARLLARDLARDLAALAVDASDLPTVELGQSRNLRPGQWVLALGHPWGVNAAVTTGVIIGMETQWPGASSHRGELIAVNLPLRPGNSGGPLVDVQGRLVGIGTASATSGPVIMVPIHAAKTFLRESLGSQRALGSEAATGVQDGDGQAHDH